MGAFINDTTPELVAERLRAVTVPASPAEELAPSAPALIEGAHA
jgi:UDPglucose--hexose-1-phosphate uridylyltransferase